MQIMMPQLPVSPDQRLTEIRTYSNVVQALENLINQCQGLNGFWEERRRYGTDLNAFRDGMRKLIHASVFQF